MTRSNISRAVLAAAALFAAGPAMAQSPVEDYAQKTIEQGIGVLKDKALSNAERRAELRNFLGSTLDLRRIAIFTLGDRAKDATQAQIDAYVKAFTDFTLTSYVSRVGGYDGQSLSVFEARERAPGDFIVSVHVNDPTDPPGTPPDTALFRVLKEPDGGFGVVDASVQGIWFEVAEREDIQGYLGQNDGDIGKLTEHLNAMTAEMKSGS